MEHRLKSWPALFEPLLQGKKTHDLRRSDDRAFQVGDTLLLQEFDPDAQCYTGRECRVNVTYITSTAVPCAFYEVGLQPGFCILSVKVSGAMSDEE